MTDRLLITLEYNNRRGRGLITVCPILKDPVPTWVFENQPIESGIITQLSRYNRAETNLLADEKGPQQGDPGSCLFINLYYRFIQITIDRFNNNKNIHNK